MNYELQTLSNVKRKFP